MSAPQIDLDKLEQAAKAAQEHSVAMECDWFTAEDCPADPADGAFIAAASPEGVLALISRLRAAEENYQAATLRANANAEMLKGLLSQQQAVADRDAIRRIFIAHGFTIKEGQTDLKPYVYQAAEALLRELLPAVAATAPESGSQQ